MKKFRLKLFVALTLGLALFAGSSQPVQAADNGAQFTLSPVYPDNQTDRSLGYFSLVTKPGQQGKLTVEVANLDTKNTRTLTVKPVTATTNDAGQIDYTPTNRPADGSAKLTLTQIISPGVTVKLSPNTKRPITFNYTVPKEGFEGTILGSIYVLDETTSDASKGKFAFKNRFAMALGVSMTNNDKKVISPELKLSEVAPTTITGNLPGVRARLRNVEPTYFRGMTINARVTKKGSDKTLYSKKTKDGSMAPNSFFDFRMGTKERAIPAGDYTMRMQVKAVGKTWNFNENFTVTAEQSAKIAKKTGQKSLIPWWVWVIGAAFLLLLLIIIYLLWRISQQKRGEDDANKR